MPLPYAFSLSLPFAFAAAFAAYCHFHYFHAAPFSLIRLSIASPPPLTPFYFATLLSLLSPRYHAFAEYYYC